MRNGVLAIFCFVGILSACSSKPDVDVIQPALAELWQPCELLKFTDLKKTNGIDRNDHYEMAYSYKLVFLKDVENWPSAGICPVNQLNLLWDYAKIVHKQGVPLKKGEYIEIEDSATLIESEKGWVISQ